jgi:hypothetical protein
MNGQSQRERSHTLLTQQQAYQALGDGRTFLGGGVTESRSGFFIQTKDINYGASFGGGTIPQMTPIQSVFPFHDPKIILSQPHQSTAQNASSGRRKLPQEPGVTNQSPSPQFNTNPPQAFQQIPPPVRRASSNRTLPTPPPVSPTTMNTINTTAFSPSPSPPFNSNNVEFRRPSSTGTNNL